MVWVGAGLKKTIKGRPLAYVYSQRNDCILSVVSLENLMTYRRHDELADSSPEIWQIKGKIEDRFNRSKVGSERV